jgi:hypothetical protein
MVYRGVEPQSGKTKDYAIGISVLGNLIKIRSLIAPDYVAQQNWEAIKDRILIRLGA